MAENAPPPPDLGARMIMLEHQNTTLLVLSSINMIMNVATIAVAALIAM